MRVVLSAFEPFGAHAVNASLEAARRVAAVGVSGLEIDLVELPVVRGTASELLLAACERARPDAVVMLGINERSWKITPERVAINLDDYGVADNAGNAPVEEPIAPDGPAAYFSTLPVRWLAAALRDGGIAAEVSNSAGTYLCNHVFYAARHHAARTGATWAAGFVHVPQMREAVDDGAPSMPLAEIVRGVRIVLESLAQSLRSAR